MVYGSGAAGGAAAAAAAIANAIRATGAIVSLDESEFQKILGKAEDIVVVHSYSGWPAKKHRYLTSYKGLFFYSTSLRPLNMPSRAEVVECHKIWIPS